MPRTDTASPHPSQPHEAMVVSSAKVATATLFSRLAGFARDVVLAAYFGATGHLDAYFVASSIPTTIEAPVGTILRSSFVSIYSRLLGRGERAKAARLNSLALSIAAPVAAVLAVAAAVGAGPLIHLFAPGLAPQNAAVATAMLRVLLPLTLFSVGASWASSALNSHGVFGVPATAGVLKNIVLIAAVFLTAGVFHIWGLVWGTLVSSALAATWVIVVARRNTPMALPSLASEKPEMLAIFRLALPMMIVGLAMQLNVVVDQFLASRLGPGSISAIIFGSRLAQTPVGFLGASVATVIFPSLARQAGKENGEAGVFYLTQRGWAGALAVLAPFVALLVALRLPVVDLVYGRGYFTADAVAATAWAMAFYAAGIPAWGWSPVTMRSFYALGDSRTPAAVAAVAVVVNAGASFALAPLLGVGGIALGTSIAATLQAAILSHLLCRRLGRRPGPALWKSVAKITVATIVGLLPAWGLSALLAPALGGPSHPGKWFELARVAVFGAAYVAGYGATVLLLRVPEVTSALRTLWDRARHLLRRGG